MGDEVDVLQPHENTSSASRCLKHLTTSWIYASCALHAWKQKSKHGTNTDSKKWFKTREVPILSLYKSNHQWSANTPAGCLRRILLQPDIRREGHLRLASIKLALGLEHLRTQIHYWSSELSNHFTSIISYIILYHPIFAYFFHILDPFFSSKPSIPLLISSRDTKKGSKALNSEISKASVWSLAVSEICSDYL